MDTVTEEDLRKALQRKKKVSQSNKKRKKAAFTRGGQPIYNDRNEDLIWQKDHIVHITREYAEELLTRKDIPSELKKTIIWNLEKFESDPLNGDHSIEINISNLIDYDILGSEKKNIVKED